MLKSEQWRGKDQVKDLLIDFKDVFSKDEFDLGTFKEIKHKINLKDESKVVKHQMQRVPLGMESAEEQVVHNMLENDIIQESTSDFSSRPVLVKKKSGAIRFTVDFRELNENTVKIATPSQ